MKLLDKENLVRVFGVEEGFEEYKKLREKGYRVLVQLSEKDLKDPKIVKKIQELYQVSRASGFRARNRGYFRPNHNELDTTNYRNISLKEKIEFFKKQGYYHLVGAIKNYPQYQSEKNRKKFIIELLDEEKEEPNIRFFLKEKYGVKSSKNIREILKRGYFLKIPEDLGSYYQTYANRKEKRSRILSLLEKSLKHITGLKKSLEEIDQFKKRGHRILIEFDQDDLNNIEEVRKILTQKYHISPNNFHQKMKQGFVILNSKERDTSRVYPEFAEKFAKEINDISQKVAYIYAKRYQGAPYFIKQSRKDLAQDIAEEILLKMKDIASEGKTKEEVIDSLHKYAFGAAKYLIKAWKPYSRIGSSLYYEEDGNLRRDIEKLKEFPKEEEGWRDLPIKLKPIMRVFTQYGPEAALFMFNLDEKYEKLLYEIAVKNQLLEGKNFQDKVLKTIFDYFPNSHINRANSGSIYVTVHNPFTGKEIGVIRISDHKRKRAYKQNIILDIHDLKEDWKSKIEQLFIEQTKENQAPESDLP